MRIQGYGYWSTLGYDMSQFYTIWSVFFNLKYCHCVYNIPPPLTILSTPEQGQCVCVCVPKPRPSLCVCQQVRETETWMPMKTTQTVAMSTHNDLVSSGDSHNGSDFGFTDDEDEDDYDTYGDDEDEYDDEEFSGSGDGGWFSQGLQINH